MGISSGQAVMPLLATRFFAPPLSETRVERPHLLARLDGGLAAPLILVSASAGFGKSTLVSEWIAARPGVHAGWLSLEPSDNDWAHFFRYLVAAWQRVFPQAGKTALAALQAAASPNTEALVDALLNDLLAGQESAGAGHSLLVLDDYHRIETQSIHQTLAYMVEHLPPGCHLVLVTRVDPPLPLSRWRTRRTMLELRTDDLRFSSAETAAFLNQSMQLDLSAAQVDILEARTEGWIAGLQLAALSLQGCDDPQAFVDAFGSSHHFVLDYLVEEVVSQQSGEIQDFLLALAPLERFCGPLCDTLLDAPPGTGQQTLEKLARANLFLIPLDDQRQWFRFHHLFADLLRVRLRQTAPQRLPELNRQAARWFAECQQWHEAIRYALAAGDFDLGADLFEQATCVDGLTFLFGGIRSLVDPFPDDWIVSRPILSLAKAVCLIESSQVSNVEPLLRAAEQGLPEDLLGVVFVVQGMAASLLGDCGWTAEASQQAIERMPGNARALVTAWIQLGNASLFEGNLRENVVRWSKALQLSEVARYHIGISNCLVSMGRNACHMGDLRRAEALFQRALAYFAENPSPRWLAAAQRDYSDLLRERNRLGEAHAMMTIALEGCRQWDSTSGFGLACFHLGRILLAQGDLSGAEHMLEEAERLRQTHTVYPDLQALLQVFRARLALEAGDLGGAWDVLDACLRSPCCEHELHREWVLVAQARVLSRMGQPAEALALMDGRLEEAQRNGRGRNWLEMTLLSALALDALGKQQQAMEVLGGGLAYAQSQGFVRLLVDEGNGLRALLRQFLQRHPASPRQPYVRSLLSAFDAPAQEPAGGSLLDPLTEREAEILALVCEGYSNTEIADRLVLSVGTVKTHIHNIFGKLGVSTRPKAIATARQMHAAAQEHPGYGRSDL